MNNIIDQINIPITESDLEMFKDLVYSGETFSWTFKTEDSEELVEVNFIQEESEEVSDCCGADIIENTDLCSDCKEHCGIQEGY